MASLRVADWRQAAPTGFNVAKSVTSVLIHKVLRNDKHYSVTFLHLPVVRLTMVNADMSSFSN